MSGKFKGVKTRILNDNPHAYFSPCGAHSLNLCGVHAMEVSTEVKSYFGNVQKLYKTFSMSPSRWKILQTTTGVSLHSVSTTRWSARVDAIRPLTKRYQDIIHALVSISDETNLPPETQADVDALITWMNSFEFVLFTKIWYKTLKVIDERNKVLQNSKITVKDSAKIMEGLISDIATIRSSWDKFLEESKSIASTFLISPEFKPTRGRKKKTFFDDSEVPDHSFNVTDRFKVEVFLPSIDLLSLEIKSITEKMKELSDVFTPIISPTENTLQLNQLYVDGVAEDLVNGYPRDLTKDELANELTIYFKLLKDGVINSGEGNLNCAVDILNNIYQKGLEHILPQICTCLRLLAVIPVSVSGERAFSKMSLIKNRLRSAMGEDRLNHLMILSIEHDIVRKISFDEVIEDFARLKYGFNCSFHTNEEQPVRLICKEVLAAESMKPSKLQRHLNTKHATLLKKPIEYFERLLQTSNKEKNTLEKYVTLNDKYLLAVSYLIAKTKKPFTTGEQLLLPAAIRMSEIVHGNQC
ncbi:uncharacterized protein LOC130896566 [Diorhabda carinulata]|uniref:uncharacterized protein LOC130896566 n=1 Tax=Diorhabda carinulata TaxID=1163345 RepID=UPI0025A20300|nr:uncharacterized protein LOC130896566 [Diorhabda carinulata]